MAPASLQSCSFCHRFPQDMRPCSEIFLLEQVAPPLLSIANARLPSLALYIAVAKKQGVAPAQLTGNDSNDIFERVSALARTFILRTIVGALLLTLCLCCSLRCRALEYRSVSAAIASAKPGLDGGARGGFHVGNGIAYVEAAL